MNKIFTIFILTVFVTTPFYAWAQQGQNTDTTNAPRAIPVNTNNNNDTTNAPRAIPVYTDTRGNYQGVTSETGEQFKAQSIQQGASDCAIGSVLSGAIKTYVGGLVSSGADVTSLTATPVAENQLRLKETGTLTSVGTSWDAIGYCLLNSVIEYIGYSTVQWINTGFQGNPVFVEDPSQFFADIADIEAGNMLNEISGGLICSPFKDLVVLNLSNMYNQGISSFDNRAQCSFTAISGNLEQFMAGEVFSWQDWLSFNQPQNNPYGATLLAQMELANRIQQQTQTQSQLLDWGRGFRSITNKKGEIVSPGSIIQEQLNERLGSGQRRLEIADEFDEIVNALVNQLVRIALSEMTQTNR